MGPLFGRHAKTFDYFDHRIHLEPLRPGLWRYRVHQLSFVDGQPARLGPMVCDQESATYMNAKLRAKDVVRRRRKRGARWPHA